MAKQKQKRSDVDCPNHKGYKLTTGLYCHKCNEYPLKDKDEEKPVDPVETKPVDDPVTDKAPVEKPAENASPAAEEGNKDDASNPEPVEINKVDHASTTGNIKTESSTIEKAAIEIEVETPKENPPKADPPKPKSEPKIHPPLLKLPIRIDLAGKDKDEVRREAVGAESKIKSTFGKDCTTAGYKENGKRDDSHPDYILIDKAE